jgi:hypothetical protein
VCAARPEKRPTIPRPWRACVRPSLAPSDHQSGRGHFWLDRRLLPRRRHARRSPARPLRGAPASHAESFFHYPTTSHETQNFCPYRRLPLVQPVRLVGSSRGDELGARAGRVAPRGCGADRPALAEPVARRSPSLVRVLGGARPPVTVGATLRPAVVECQRSAARLASRTGHRASCAGLLRRKAADAEAGSPCGVGLRKPTAG